MGILRTFRANIGVPISVRFFGTREWPIDIFARRGNGIGSNRRYDSVGVKRREIIKMGLRIKNFCGNEPELSQRKQGQHEYFFRASFKR